MLEKKISITSFLSRVLLLLKTGAVLNNQNDFVPDYLAQVLPFRIPGDTFEQKERQFQFSRRCVSPSGSDLAVSGGWSFFVLYSQPGA